VVEACVQLAIYGYEPAPAVRERAAYAARRAVALAPGHAASHAALGAERFMLAWDWSGAGEAFARARALAPSDPQAQSWQALHQLCTGAGAGDAVATAAAALTLDPLGATGRVLLASLLVAARRPTEAEGCAREALALGAARRWRTTGSPRRCSPAGGARGARRRAGRGRGGGPRAVGAGQPRARRRARRRAGARPRRARPSSRRRRARTTCSRACSPWRTWRWGRSTRPSRCFAEALEARDPALVLVSAFPAFDEVRDDPRWTALVRQADAERADAWADGAADASAGARPPRRRAAGPPPARGPRRRRRRGRPERW
jgi:hypothetical protein